MEQVKDDKVNAHQKKVDSCQSENRSRTCSKLSKNIKTDSPQSINCPMCGYVLYKRYSGLVCKNHKCELYHKLDNGWIKIDKSNNHYEKFNLEYLFSYNRINIKSKWLILKRTIFKRDNYTCQECNINLLLSKEHFQLHAHHIIPKAEAPELTLDEENIITLCENCHKNIHRKDKYSFRKRDDE